MVGGYYQGSGCRLNLNCVESFHIDFEWVDRKKHWFITGMMISGRNTPIGTGFDSYEEATEFLDKLVGIPVITQDFNHQEKVDA